ncbi:hypothetical protein [Acinetobacter higginsii]|uniref:hypothetical protein n=1 Tax=Acinetobacter higginsii TaxID=70347 RepID=UPI001F613DDD|nr:hypothetical protein [Acinetobacter higginsii]MCI3879570.1 hypothetical protein [Acinetobacter higginsii]
MKNLKNYEIFIILLCCILICLEISIFGKVLIGYDSDYLSSGVTLFAAFIAWVLYSDWRDPYSAQKLDEERSAVRSSARIFRNCYYEFNSHVLNSQGGTLNSAGPYFAEYMRLESQLLNSLDDLSENLHFYSSFFNDHTDEADTQTHKDNLIVYSGLIIDFHNIFQQIDPYTNFSGAFSNINVNVRNNFFLNIVGKLSKDLPSELAVMQQSALKKK